MTSEQTRQTKQPLPQRQDFAHSNNNNMQSHTHIKTQSYQPKPMQNEIPLTYDLQKHEIT